MINGKERGEHNAKPTCVPWLVNIYLKMVVFCNPILSLLKLDFLRQFHCIPLNCLINTYYLYYFSFDAVVIFFYLL